ncbi:RNA polymerase III subunit Rpc17, partial [Protomyces lactucae-debilis]
MKILEARSSFLTNHEVALHIQELVRFQDSHLKHEGSYTSALESDNLRTVQYELQAYLDSLPVSQVNAKRIRAFCTELLTFDPAPPPGEESLDLSLTSLTKGEKLMCINNVPSNVAELSAVIEEFTDRFKAE